MTEDLTPSMAGHRLLPEGASHEDYLSSLLGERYAAYRRKWKSFCRGESLVEDFPLQLDFQLNNRCNLRCQMCPWSTPRGLADAGAPALEFPLEKFRSIVEEGVRGGCLRVINFEGLNEPLLKKDLPAYVASAKEAGAVDLTLHTNGLLLDEPMAEGLIRSGLTQLLISIDAFSAQTYRKIRSSTRYEALMTNIRRFLEIRTRLGAKLPLLRTNFVIQPDNAHEAEAFRVFWSRNADFVLMQELIDMTGLVRDKRQYKTSATFCPQPFYRMSIKANGDAFPCCCSLGHLHLADGNVFKTGIPAIWKGEGFRRIRELFKSGRYREIPACRTCLDDVYIV